MEMLSGALAAYVALGAAGMAVVGVALAATLFFSFTERGWQAFLGLAALVAGCAADHPDVLPADALDAGRPLPDAGRGGVNFGSIRRKAC